MAVITNGQISGVVGVPALPMNPAGTGRNLTALWIKVTRITSGYRASPAQVIAMAAGASIKSVKIDLYAMENHRLGVGIINCVNMAW